MADTANLALPYIAASQAQKHVTHNEALRLLDGIVQLSVKDRNLTAPPGSPAEGARYIVAAAPTGAWAGWAGSIAMWADGSWFRLIPEIGWVAWVEDEALVLRWRGGAWQDDTDLFMVFARLGIGTTPDPTNRLVVVSPATLLNHAGAGHQLKLNKAAAGDTASLLFQTGFSGRAEMGAAGNDDFSVKVSPDGAAWTTALQIAAATGLITGAAVVSSGSDTTAGRLLKVGAGHQQLDASLYRLGNALGTVGQSGGVPTGALIERGSNANGEYRRFADGTQICTATIVLTYSAGTHLALSWTYPAAFVSGSSPSPLGNLISSAVSMTPSLFEVGALQFGSPTVTSTAVQLRRVQGMTNFGAADTATVRIAAIGRWF